MSPPLEIPNWDSRFETAQSRAVSTITWTPLRHAFAATLRAQAPDVAAAMVQVVILAAMMPRRGTFNDGGRDLTLDDIACCVGMESPLIAKAISALGGSLSHQEKEGGKEEREEKPVLRDATHPSEPSSAGADAGVKMVVRVWNENRGPLPEVKTVGKDRLKLVRLLATDSECDETLLASAVAAFASDPFNRERHSDIDTLCRHRSKWLDFGRNGYTPPAPRNGKANFISGPELFS